MKYLLPLALTTTFILALSVLLFSQRQQIVDQATTIEVLAKDLGKTAQKNANLVNTNSVLRKRILDLETSMNQNDLKSLPVNHSFKEEVSLYRNVTNKSPR